MNEGDGVGIASQVNAAVNYQKRNEQRMKEIQDNVNNIIDLWEQYLVNYSQESSSNCPRELRKYLDKLSDEFIQVHKIKQDNDLMGKMQEKLIFLIEFLLQNQKNGDSVNYADNNLKNNIMIKKTCHTMHHIH